MTAIDIPLALHRGENELPFVDLGDGSDLQLLQVDVEAGLWVIRTRFQPGYLVPTHKHTGEVFAFTHSGSWKYVEYPEVNTAGSYLFEPAGSVHTLTVPDDQRRRHRRVVRHPRRQPQPRRGRQRRPRCSTPAASATSTSPCARAWACPARTSSASERRSGARAQLGGPNGEARSPAAADRSSSPVARCSVTTDEQRPAHQPGGERRGRGGRQLGEPAGQPAGTACRRVRPAGRGRVAGDAGRRACPRPPAGAAPSPPRASAPTTQAKKRREPLVRREGRWRAAGRRSPGARRSAAPRTTARSRSAFDGK